MPGYAAKSLATMGAIGGNEKFLPHYDQLLQYLAELHVVLQAVSFDWGAPVRFLLEPTAEGSKKNPALTVECGGVIFGIEVKAPALRAHAELHGTNRTQVPSRGFTSDMLDQLKGTDEKLTLPRDNPGILEYRDPLQYGGFQLDMFGCVRGTRRQLDELKMAPQQLNRKNLP